MKRKEKHDDPVVERLDAVLTVLQDLLILECARTGMKRPELRTIVAVDNNRISRIARHVKPLKNEKDG
jgi:hypothetical protein